MPRAWRIPATLTHRTGDSGTVLPDLNRASDNEVEVTGNGCADQHVASPDIRALCYGEEFRDIAGVEPIDRSATILVADGELGTGLVDRYHIVLSHGTLDIVECAFIELSSKCGAAPRPVFIFTTSEVSITVLTSADRLVLTQSLHVGSQHAHR